MLGGRFGPDSRRFGRPRREAATPIAAEAPETGSFISLDERPAKACCFKTGLTAPPVLELIREMWAGTRDPRRTQQQGPVLSAMPFLEPWPGPGIGRNRQMWWDPRMTSEMGWPVSIQGGQCGEGVVCRLFKTMDPAMLLPLYTGFTPSTVHPFLFIPVVTMFGKSLVYFTAALGVANAASYKATMTAYGSSDDNGSGNCKKTGACGFYFDVSPLPMVVEKTATDKETSPVTLQPSRRTSTA